MEFMFKAAYTFDYHTTEYYVATKISDFWLSTKEKQKIL